MAKMNGKKKNNQHPMSLQISSKYRIVQVPPDMHREPSTQNTYEVLAAELAEHFSEKVNAIRVFRRNAQGPLTSQTKL